MSTCISGYNQTTQQCTQTADQGYNQCTQTEDQGYNQCDSWGFFSFLCDGWVWISNIVCVAWTWISNIVCVAWAAVTVFICTIWDVVSTAVRYIFETIVSLLSPLLNAVAFIVQLLFAIPILGRILNWLVNAAVSIVWAVVGVVDTIIGLLGIRPEKRLYLIVINQRDESGNPVASTADLLASINLAIQVFRDDANIRVLPYRLFDYTTPAASDQQASSDYIVNLSSNSTPLTLDVECGASDYMDDLGFAGAQFQNMLAFNTFWSGWRQVLGYGAPVIAFAIRKFLGTCDGQTTGPLGNLVLVNFSGAATDTTTPGQPHSASILAHEMGHSCYLWHVSPSNLMQPKDPRTTNLDWWQIAIIRSSRHVTYF